MVNLEASQGSVQIPSLTPTIILIFHADRALHALGDDGSVYVWGEGDLNPLCFILKSPGIDNASR